ncbi:uncharacterized protein BDR25DRAFT_246547 [Lindgomyces ingoldianus]|uniref:Uncharacterized protein n=1 Tax=Lindgomyces ingoldianus TaxID=673940 RepID=A0ACB6Q857_9PLEO|nr:uncharacterized protein BDR25DRAFT_246547 [Lindgomyces ingoldianus]KAF2463052.1 hypothetical protein BDR25DRAFT_246547 [Lindgomyces ingoldianus]
MSRFIEDYPGLNSARAASLVVAMMCAIMQLPLDSKIAPLPSPSRIPFQTFMDIPLPLRNTGEDFTKCHINKMTSANFLTGDWIGYYNDLRGWGRRERFYLDPPMRRIRLIARPVSLSEKSSPNDKTIIDGVSGGVDGFHTFSLSGMVSANGDVKLRKTYIHQGWSWMWWGVVTPFGIVGAWGREHEGRFGGHFWIWKNEWCESLTEQATQVRGI